jgi:hypothetical protein
VGVVNNSKTMYASYFAPPQPSQPKPYAYAPIAQCAEKFGWDKIKQMGLGMGIPEKKLDENRSILNDIDYKYGHNGIPDRPLTAELNKIRHEATSGKHIQDLNHVEKFMDGRSKDFFDATNHFDKDTHDLLEAELKGGFVDSIFINTFGQCLVYCSGASKNDITQNWLYWYLKYFALSLSLGLYIMCLAFIAGVQLSVDACHVGLVKKNFNANTTTHCDSMIEDCKFRWLTSYRETGVGDYLKWRLASYILSLLPLMFMAYASGRHMKNTVNRLLAKHQEKMNEATSSESVNVKRWGSLLTKTRLENISLILFFVVYIVIGSLILALDVQFAKFLDNKDDKEGGGKCKESFQENADYIPFLQPNQTPETLCKILLSFNCFSMLWAVFYVIITTYKTCCGSVRREEAAKSINRRIHPETAGGADSAHNHIHAAAAHPYPQYPSSTFSNPIASNYYGGTYPAPSGGGVAGGGGFGGGAY